MTLKFMNMYQCEPWEKDTIESVYEKMAYFYHAKCEMYDRSLTEIRSQHDNTEAFVIGENKRYSIHYSMQLRKKISEWYENKYNIPFEINTWRKSINVLNRFSSQQIIDMYEHFLKNNDVVVCEIDDNLR